MKAVIAYSGGGAESSPDNRDTLSQRDEVAHILQEMGIETRSVLFGDSLDVFEKSLRGIKPDFIFNLVETVGGSDRLLYMAAAFFEHLKIPYTGCPAVPLAILSSKIRQKELLQLAGLPTPDFFTDKNDRKFSGGPWIVKSDTEHASVGIGPDSVVQSAILAKTKIFEKKREFGGDWFAEAFVDGREFNISVLEGKDGKPQVLPPAEIVFVDYPKDKPKIVDYEAKWDDKSHAYHATPRRFDFGADDKNLLAQLESLCCRCWDLFGLKGAARVDFRIDSGGRPWILEVNPNACLSSDAGFMVAAGHAGLGPQSVIERLLPLAAGREYK